MKISMASIEILFFSAIGILFVGLSLCDKPKFDESDLRKNFDKINEYLSEKVETDDAETNMAKAAEWSQELSNKLKGCFSLHRKSKIKLETILNLFLSMRNWHELVSCSKGTLKDLESIDMATGYPRMNAKGTKPTRRIEKLAHYYMKMHYDLCYPDLVSHYVDELSHEDRDRIMSLLYDDPKAKRVVTRGHFDIYLVRPCEELKSKMGDKFNDNIRPESTNFDVKPEEEQNSISKRNSIKNCQFILENPDGVWQKMHDIVENEKMDE